MFSALLKGKTTSVEPTFFMRAFSLKLNSKLAAKGKTASVEPTFFMRAFSLKLNSRFTAGCEIIHNEQKAQSSLFNHFLTRS